MEAMCFGILLKSSMHLSQHLQYIIDNEYENPFLKMGSDYGSFNIRI